MSLLENVEVKKIVRYADPEVEHIAFDSRKDCEKSLFVCLRGEKADGHDFALDAERNGALALVVEKEIVGSALPQFVVRDPRKAFAIICGNFFGNPARKLKLVTVVGTNGKTSTTEILCRIFNEAGRLSATIGTLGYMIGAERSEGMLTTPDPLELHEKLAEMVSKGVEYVFLEASAHAIYYSKLAGIKACLSIFTNITQDHLDFFETMERYAEVKLSYFRPENTAIAVVNSDDEYGRRLILKSNVPTISYGLYNPADVFAINVTEGQNGLSFTLNAYDLIADITTPLCGKFNVYNVMAATTAAMYLGVELSTIAKALKKMAPVPGRFVSCDIKGRRVIVDYAHTPDGLENLLSSVKKEATGRVITVFGCGGDRDKSKRPIMGQIASHYSDYVIVTDDNPRFEKEEEIADQICKGIAADSLSEVILDRTEAIMRAFSLAQTGDTVVIAGKGHESTMEINGKKYPYSDLAILEKLGR